MHALHALHGYLALFIVMVSSTILRRAEKSTKSGIDKDAECEKCNKLIELIFGPSKPPATIKAIKKTELPEADWQHIHETHKTKIEMIDPQVKRNAEKQCEMHDSETLEKEGITLSKVPMEDVHLHSTTAKQTEVQLAEKVEFIDEKPVVEAEKPKIEEINAPSVVLNHSAEANLYQNIESRKFDDIEDTTDEKLPDKDYKMDTIESMVRRIEETLKLKDVRRVEQLMTDEIERSDFKLPTLNCASDRQNRKPGASTKSDQKYEELAKRCLNAPSDQIDKRLLKEMQNLGVPHTNSSREESTVIEENIIQVDVLKKPRKPIKKTEFDLEIREFKQDPSIADADKLQPAFQTFNSPKTISKDNTDSADFKVERIQLYELDKKPLAYSQETQESEKKDSHKKSMVFESSSGQNQATTDLYDKATIGNDKDKTLYPKYSFGNESKLQLDEVKSHVPTQLIAVSQTFQSSNKSEPIQGSKDPIDQLKDKTEPFTYNVPVSKCSIYQAEDETQPRTAFNVLASKRSTFQPKDKMETRTFYNCPVSECSIYQTNYETEPRTALDVPVSESPIDQLKGEQLISDNQTFPEEGDCDSRPEPKAASNTNAFIKPATEKITLLINLDSKSTSETIKENVDSGTMNSTQPENTKPFEATPIVAPDVTFNEPIPNVAEAQSATAKSNTVQYNSNLAKEQISHSFVEPNAAVGQSTAAKSNTEQYNPNLSKEQISHSFVQPNVAVDQSTTAKSNTEQYNPNLSKEQISHSFVQPNVAVDQSTAAKSNTEQYNTNLATEQISHSFVQPNVAVDQSTAPKSNTEQYNTNLATEQISHSFVQPQTMVNPLVNSQTLAEPADELQETISAAAACKPLPSLKGCEELPLSEMLKRVRMRSKILCCQAAMEPLTGKCGKKTPPCPPPAPKCPPSCPPPCPPAPPPCPKPCKPACSPPCPPPCPAPTPPSKCKCKRHFPCMNFKELITLLLKPESDIQKSTSDHNISCEQTQERIRFVLTKEVSLKLQEIGLNLLIAYPRKIAVSLSSSFNAESLTLARDYEPWVPIPSWPIPKKEKKRPFVCPKEGCKLIPPPQLRPPCNETPCIDFPKRT